MIRVRSTRRLVVGLLVVAAMLAAACEIEPTDDALPPLKGDVPTEGRTEAPTDPKGGGAEGDEGGHGHEHDGKDPAAPPTTEPPTTEPPTTEPPTTEPPTTEPPHEGDGAGDHSGHGMPYVNRDAIPSGSGGHSTARVRSTDQVPGSSGGDGAFRTVCDFSHMNFDDPLVFPGVADATHLHAFFGNTAVDHRSTAESIMSTGNSTCRGGIVNRSAYWVPAIIDTRDGTPIQPRDMVIYYKSGWSHHPNEVQAHPAGLRILAGDPGASSPQSRLSYKCGDRSMPHIPADCPGQSDLSMSIEFPQCWNGRDLDSADHRSHMAFPGHGGCPSSHPVVLPVITFNVHYPVDGGDTGAWRLSSDMYSHDIPGGYSGHADWWDGWDEATKQEWVAGCTSVQADCHAHLLGPNRAIY